MDKQIAIQILRIDEEIRMLREIKTCIECDKEAIKSLEAIINRLLTTKINLYNDTANNRDIDRNTDENKEFISYISSIYY